MPRSFIQIWEFPFSAREYKALFTRCICANCQLDQSPSFNSGFETCGYLYHCHPHYSTARQFVILVATGVRNCTQLLVTVCSPSALPGTSCMLLSLKFLYHVRPKPLTSPGLRKISSFHILPSCICKIQFYFVFTSKSRARS